jgi:hypothetical protein
VTNLFHEHDGSFNCVIVDKIKLIALCLNGKKHIKDGDDDGLLEEFATEKFTDELNVAKETSLELQDVLLVLALEQLLSLICEELIKTVATECQQKFTEK